MEAITRSIHLPLQINAKPTGTLYVVIDDNAPAFSVEGEGKLAPFDCDILISALQAYITNARPRASLVARPHGA